MAAFISSCLIIVSALLALPVSVLALEIVAAIGLPQRNVVEGPGEDYCLRVAVLVPAHNESSGLLPTVADIMAQIREGDRLLVVADNCTDDTDVVAARAGAEVAVRNDLERVGKGYALAWGVRQLSIGPPDVVIVIDADCRLGPSTIKKLAQACSKTGRPVQALYLMTSSGDCPINLSVAEFAWRVKNWARPSGLLALGLPCQLMGSGMAFPWNVIRSADLASGAIVEDLKLGLDLAVAGAPTIFYPFASVTSHFPHSLEGVQNQRQRWEHGHLRLILSAVPKLSIKGLLRGNLSLMALALDLAVPPLVLLGLLALGSWLLSFVAALAGISFTPLLIASADLLAFIFTTVVCWVAYGRDILPPRSFFAIASYGLGKLTVYRNFFLFKSTSRWIRTDRRKI